MLILLKLLFSLNNKFKTKQTLLVRPFFMPQLLVTAHLVCKDGNFIIQNLRDF